MTHHKPLGDISTATEFCQYLAAVLAPRETVTSHEPRALEDIPWDDGERYVLLPIRSDGRWLWRINDRETDTIIADYPARSRASANAHCTRLNMEEEQSCH